MATTEGSGAKLIGGNKVLSAYTGDDMPQPKGDFLWYHSGTPAGSGGAGTAGFCNVTSESTLATFDVGGFKHFSICLHNRDDEDIDGGGANNQDLYLYAHGSNDPDFAAGKVSFINGTTVGEGIETTWHFGEGIRGWVDDQGTPFNYDYDGSSLVTIANEGFPFRYLQLGLKAQTAVHVYFV